MEFTIGMNHIAPSDKAIITIKDLELPKNIKDVRRIIGIINYIKSFLFHTDIHRSLKERKEHQESNQRKTNTPSRTTGQNQNHLQRKTLLNLARRIFSLHRRIIHRIGSSTFTKRQQ